jgi:hypothetical protein
VLRADPRSEVFIFADSDARPGRNWLSSLVAALENKNIGAATGYRWLIAPNPTLGSELCSAWNASIATALGPNTRSNFCWGGSMAISRDTFERLGIREKWAGTLSDDFALTHGVKGAGTYGVGRGLHVRRDARIYDAANEDHSSLRSAFMADVDVWFVALLHRDDRSVSGRRAEQEQHRGRLGSAGDPGACERVQHRQILFAAYGCAACSFASRGRITAATPDAVCLLATDARGLPLQLHRCAALKTHQMARDHIRIEIAP